MLFVPGTGGMADNNIGFRDVCNVEAMLKVYATTGDPALLAKARQTYDNFDRTQPASGFKKLCEDSVIHEHGVTCAQMGYDESVSDLS